MSSDTTLVNPQKSEPDLPNDSLVVLIDLRLAYDTMAQVLAQAYQNRGIVQVSPEEIRETSDYAVGGIVTYVIEYVKHRARPMINVDQPNITGLATRLGDVFATIGEAVRALNEVEQIVCMVIGNNLDPGTGNNFEVLEYKLGNYTLMVAVRPLAPMPLPSAQANAF